MPHLTLLPLTLVSFIVLQVSHELLCTDSLSEAHNIVMCTFIKGSCYAQLSFHNFYILRCVLSPTNCHSHVAHDSKNVEDMLLTCNMTFGENLKELYGSRCSLPHVEFCFSHTYKCLSWILPTQHWPPLCDDLQRMLVIHCWVSFGSLMALWVL